MHIDNWVKYQVCTADKTYKYAAWVLYLFRMPAAERIAFAPWIEQFKLYAVYRGSWYQVVGASRLGDVWLRNLDSKYPDGPDSFYNHRVDIEELSEFTNALHPV